MSKAWDLGPAEDPYRAFFDNAGDPMAVVEEDGTIILSNAEFEALTGYSKEEIEGRLRVSDLVLQEDLRAVLAVRRQRQEGKSVTRHENRIRCKDGTLKYVAVTGVLIPRTTFNWISVRDITQGHLLQKELLRRNQELEAVHSVASILSGSTDLGPMLQQVLEKVLEISGLKRGFIYLLDQEQGKLFVEAHSGAPRGTVKGVDGLALGEGFGGRVAQAGEALFIPDMSRDPRLARPIVLKQGFRCLASIPLVSGGKVLGTMSLDGKQAREFTPEDQRLLISMGNEIGVTVDRALLLQKARERASEMEGLVSLTRQMVSTLDLQEVLDRFLAVMCRQVGATRGFICVLNEERGELTTQTFWGERASPPDKVWKVGEGVVGWVALHQQPVISDDIGSDPRFHGALSPALGNYSSVAAPLKVKGKLMGVLIAASQKRAAFNSAHLRLVTAYAAEASMALENALLHQAVKRQASTDELTQLSNRRHFYERLEVETKRSRRYGHHLSLLFMDVDDLKGVNDHHGHAQGDFLLRHLASHVTQVIRGTDMAARLGGDEFVVLLPETSREVAGRVAERLIREATPCPLISGGSIPWRMSIGIAWAPVEGSYEVDLLKLADEAVYRAKEKDTGWEFARPEARQASLPLEEEQQNTVQE